MTAWGDVNWSSNSSHTICIFACRYWVSRRPVCSRFTLPAPQVNQGLTAGSRRGWNLRFVEILEGGKTEWAWLVESASELHRQRIHHLINLLELTRWNICVSHMSLMLKAYISHCSHTDEGSIHHEYKRMYIYMKSSCKSKWDIAFWFREENVCVSEQTSLCYMGGSFYWISRETLSFHQQQFQQPYNCTSFTSFFTAENMYVSEQTLLCYIEYFTGFPEKHCTSISKNLHSFITSSSHHSLSWGFWTEWQMHIHVQTNKYITQS